MAVTTIKTPRDLLEAAHRLAFGDIPAFLGGLETGLLISEQRPDVAAELLAAARQSIGGEDMREDLSIELAAFGVTADPQIVVN